MELSYMDSRSIVASVVSGCKMFNRRRFGGFLLKKLQEIFGSLLPLRGDRRDFGEDVTRNGSDSCLRQTSVDKCYPNS